MLVLLTVQYFLPFAKRGINKQIEDAILRADRLGVKVISLAALNKVSFLIYFAPEIDFNLLGSYTRKRDI